MKIIVIVLLSFIALPGILYALLNSNKVQNFIADQATSILSEKLQTEVTVGDVDYRLFNTFRLEDLYIQDLRKDTLLYVNKVDVDFDFWRFFSGTFIFNKVSFDKFDGNLVIDEAGISNIDFILKAFRKSKKDEEKTLIDFNFKDIRITNSSFKLVNLKRKVRKDTTRFDSDILILRDINTVLSIDYLRGDSLLANIHSFSAKERSGLVVEDMQTRLEGYKKGFRFPHVNIKMPNSFLEMDSVRMEYDSIAGLKNVLNSVRLQAEIKPSKVAPSDFASFVPNFAKLTAPVSLQGKVQGKISGFRVQDLDLQYRNSFHVKADVDINGIPNIAETFFYADIKDLRANRGEAQDFVSRLMKEPFILPVELSRLGTVKFQGNVSGFFSNLVLYGNITTDVGILKTDILLQLENKMRDIYYNGTVQSGNFQLGSLLANETLGKAAFKINTKGYKRQHQSVQGTVTGVVPEIYIHQYTYRDISVDGSYDGSRYDGVMRIEDPNLLADFNGRVDLTQQLPVFDFDLWVGNADLNALKWTKKYEDSRLSFQGNIGMVGNSLDNTNGFLKIDSIHFANNDKELMISELILESKVDNGNSRFSVTSDLVNGYFDGIFKYSAIPGIIASVVQSYLPAVTGRNIVRKEWKADENSHIDINLTMNDTKSVSEVLELPFALDGVTTISGYLEDSAQNLDVSTPYFSYGKRTIRDIVLNLDNEDDKLNISAQGNYFQDDAYLDFDLNASAANDKLSTRFGWHNKDSILNAGELQFNTEFKKENNFSSALISFLPTEIILNNSAWKVHPSQVVINPDNTLDIQNFRLQKGSQYIVVDGIASKDERDLLVVDMNEIDLEPIMKLVNLKSITIDGKTTGTANFYGILKQPAFEANLFVKDAQLNKSPIGNAYVYSGWDNRNQELMLSGTFLEGNDTVALANGIYSPKNDSIDLIYDADGLNLGFLQRYLRNIFQSMDVRAHGTVRMYGKSKDIAFEGSAFADKGKLKVNFLNTVYSFSDSIRLTRESIRLVNVTLYDAENNQGVLNGLITHNGSFKDMLYDVDINVQNMLALDTKSTDNGSFYGKAYGTGQVHIYGDENTSHINVNAVTQPRTKINISLDETSQLNQNDFITFVNRDTTQTSAPRPIIDKHSDMFITLQLDVTPDADIQLIINPQSGDVITANGAGNVRIEYDVNNDFRMYGGYTINQGNFSFNLQNLIMKQFRIEEGSNIVFSGIPENARLDIRAIHSLTASLYDLMSSDILASTDRSSIPVEAILSLKDELTQPSIHFDINLPSSDETLKMQVRNLMNTEEMMNRQMVYLLLFGKFYTPDYNRSTPDPAATSTGISFLTSTLSGQLNNWLSQVSNNLSFGVNYRSSGYGSSVSQEYEGEIMYQPNNRFIINGNIGYRDDNFSKNKFIGDLDMEYIFSQNSKWRLKAYNHTVDRYSLRAAPYIQGVGVMYKEDFNDWNELWRSFIGNKKYVNDKTDSLTNEVFPVNNDSTLTIKRINEIEKNVGNTFSRSYN